jgi:hypothetical protein
LTNALRLASKENIFYGYPESFGNEKNKLQECSGIAIIFFLLMAASVGGRWHI